MYNNGNILRLENSFEYYGKDRKGAVVQVEPRSCHPFNIPAYIWGTSDFQKIIAWIINRNFGKEYETKKHTEQYVSIFSAPSESDNQKKKNMKNASLAHKFFSIASNAKQHEPLFINAPTGAGKSTFVLTELAQVAEWGGGKILVLSNRLALYEQMKRNICKMKNIPYRDDGECDECHVYGSIVLYTYQSVLTHWDDIIRDLGGRDPMYLVFDEVHYFISDAAFNVETENTFFLLMYNFYTSRRIYMSATPDDVKGIISAFERWFTNYTYDNTLQTVPAFIGIKDVNNVQDPKWLSYLNSCRITEHYYPPCYDNVSLCFFKEWNHIIDSIRNGEDDSKWLIFVSSIKRGQELRNKIGKTQSDMATSDKRDSRVMKDLIEKESFEKKVLISTKVLDNGVNIKDDALTNIVFDFFDKTDLIQMLGRKRRKPGEHINVYVRIPKEQEVASLKKENKKKLNFMEALCRNPLRALSDRWGRLTEDKQKLAKLSYRYDSVEITTNIFAWYQLHIQDEWYNGLYEEMRMDPNAYRNHVCEWLSIAVGNTQLLEGLLASVQELLDQRMSEIMNGEDSATISMEEAKRLEREIIDALHGANIPLSRLKIRDAGNRVPSNLNNFFKNAHMPYTAQKRKNELIIHKIEDASPDECDDE